MAVDGAFLEAHSYSGGLRHTALTDDGARPAWAPPVDSVGWRDEFPFEGDESVVEFSQREAVGGGVATWLAIYHRSVDTRLGDRGNHAGVGVWLRDRKIIDARALVNALFVLGRRLAGSTEVDAIAADAGNFSTDRFLGTYTRPADGFPGDWRGLPASSSALTTTSYRYRPSPGFADAEADVAEAVARASLDWSGADAAPRSLTLVTPRSSPPPDRAFERLAPAGTFLADVLEHLPKAFATERETLRTEAARLSSDRTGWLAERARAEERWQGEQQAQRQRWEAEQREHSALRDAEREEWSRLDGKPADADGIAFRLNTISRQLREMEAAVKVAPMRPAPRSPSPAPAQPAWPPVGTMPAAASVSATVERPRSPGKASPAVRPAPRQGPLDRPFRELGLMIGAVGTFVVVLCVGVYWFMFRPSKPSENATAPVAVGERAQSTAPDDGMAEVVYDNGVDAFGAAPGNGPRSDDAVSDDDGRPARGRPYN